MQNEQGGGGGGGSAARPALPQSHSRMRWVHGSQLRGFRKWMPPRALGNARQMRGPADDQTPRQPHAAVNSSRCGALPPSLFSPPCPRRHPAQTSSQPRKVDAQAREARLILNRTPRRANAPTQGRPPPVVAVARAITIATTPSQQPSGSAPRALYTWLDVTGSATTTGGVYCEIMGEAFALPVGGTIAPATRPGTLRVFEPTLGSGLFAPTSTWEA